MKEKAILNKIIKDENPDYYMENGLVVFTKEYLLKRGYCCERSCRHCPYGFKMRK